MLRDMPQSTAFKVTSVVILALSTQQHTFIIYFFWSVFRFAEDCAERFRKDSMASEKKRLLNLTQLVVTVVGF